MPFKPDKPNVVIWFFFFIIASSVIGTITVSISVKGLPPLWYGPAIIVIGIVSDCVGAYFLAFTKQKVFGYYCVFYGAVLIGTGTVLTALNH